MARLVTNKGKLSASAGVAPRWGYKHSTRWARWRWPGAYDRDRAEAESAAGRGTLTAREMSVGTPAVAICFLGHHVDLCPSLQTTTIIYFPKTAFITIY